MFAPRNLIIAGLVLVAVSLGPAGHGLWWLVGFLWLVPRAVRRGRCPEVEGHVDHAAQEHRVPAPDPTRDRHEAFPTRP